MLPEGFDEQSLVALGYRWLQDREDRSEWAYVWRALLDRKELLPEGIDEQSLVALGYRWLQDREDRSEWTHVWEALLDRKELLPRGVTIDTLLEHAMAWLVAREHRKDWSHVWERLFELGECVRTEVVEIAMGYLSRGFGAPHWPIVWSKLVRSDVGDETQREKLKQRGARWVLDPRNGTSKSMSWMLTGFLDLGDPPHEVLERVWSWIASNTHPSWPVIVVKAIVTDPCRPVALATLRALDQRTAGWQHRPRLCKTLQPLLVREGVPADVLDAVRAFIGRVPPDVRDSATQGPRVPRALERSFGPHVVPGLVADGVVTGTMPYGIFVACGDFHGLVHVSMLPPGVEPRQFTKGQTVRVEIIRRDQKGVGLRVIVPAYR